MAKKILIFSMSYFPFVGGAEVAVKEITDRVLPNELQFDMVTLRFDKNLPKYEKIGNVNVYRLGFTSNKPSARDLVKFPLVLNKYLFPFLAFFKARKLYKKNKYNAVWSIMANYAGFATLFFKFRYLKIPFLLTLQEGDPIEYIKKRVRFVYPLFKRIFTRADFIQAISNYLADFGKSMGFGGPIEVIPNGVDFKLFSEKISNEILSELKIHLGKKQGEKFIITTSRLVVKNGVGDLIKSLKYLPENIKLLILGEGPLEQSLKLEIKNCKLIDRVKFLGQVDYKEIPGYLKISDVFVRPSLSEGMGNSFIEAMAAEIPVIATAVGGIPDFLFDYEINSNKKPTGLFCDVESPQSIAYKIEKIFSDDKLKNEIVKNAFSIVKEKYDWDYIAKNMQEKVFARLF